VKVQVRLVLQADGPQATRRAVVAKHHVTEDRPEPILILYSL
jgi:hypothetical protein